MKRLPSTLLLITTRRLSREDLLTKQDKLLEIVLLTAQCLTRTLVDIEEVLLKSSV